MRLRPCRSSGLSSSFGLLTKWGSQNCCKKKLKCWYWCWFAFDEKAERNWFCCCNWQKTRSHSWGCCCCWKWFVVAENADVCTSGIWRDGFLYRIQHEMLIKTGRDWQKTQLIDESIFGGWQKRQFFMFVFDKRGWQDLGIVEWGVQKRCQIVKVGKMLVCVRHKDSVGIGDACVWRYWWCVRRKQERSKRKLWLESQREIRSDLGSYISCRRKIVRKSWVPSGGQKCDWIDWLRSMGMRKKL